MDVLGIIWCNDDHSYSKGNYKWLNDSGDYVITDKVWYYIIQGYSQSNPPWF